MYTVVVADDEWEIRRSLIEHISWVECGFRIVGEASNGMEALELVEKEKPDLLLTDIRMPFLTGLELARMAREVHPTIRVAILSGYDEFDYAQQAIKQNVISYMLKPISPQELVKELNVIREKIDRQFEEIVTVSSGPLQESEFFVPLMLGASSGLAENQLESVLRAQAIECGIITSGQKKLPYAVLAINAISDQGQQMKMRAHVGAVKSILKKYVPSVSGYIGGRILSLVFLESKNLEEHLSVPLGEIVEVFKRVLGTKCHIGVSGGKSQLQEGHIAYREAVDALDPAFAQSGSIRYSTDFAPQNTVCGELFGHVAELQRLLRSSDKQIMQQFIDRLFWEIREKRCSFLEIDMILSQYLSVVIQHIAVSADTETAKQIWSTYPLVYQSLTLRSLDGVHSAVREFCGVMVEELEKQNQKSGEQLAQKVLEMIRTEYDNENLTLTAIGERLHVSTNYLSQLIRKDTGETFVKLLTAQRLDSAKTLLETSSLKVIEVAGQCGYSDQYYFSHCFKKRFGQTPISLRRA